MQELLGSDLSVIANTGDDIEILGVHVSPDPDLVTYWLSGEIDEERGWGIRGRRLRRLRAPGAARRPRLVRALRPRPRRLPLPPPLPRRGRPPDRRPGADRARRSASQRGGAADVRAAGPHPGAHRRRLARAPGVPGPRRRRARGRGGRAGGHRRRRADRGGAATRRRRRRDRDRALQPGDQHRPDPRGPGNPRGDRRRRRPVVAVSPYVAGKVVKGPTEQFMAAVGRPVHRRRRRLPLRRAARRDASSTRTTPTPRRTGSRRSPPDPDGRRRGPRVASRRGVLELRARWQAGRREGDRDRCR